MARGPGRPKDPISREALLEAARATFAEHGYAGASMSRIADAAGLRKASLFHHFAGKEALYLEVLSVTLGDLGGLVGEAALDAGPYADRMDRLGGLVTTYLGARPGAARILLREIMDGGPFAGGDGQAAVLSTLALIAGFLSAGMAEGAMPPQDPKQLALTICGIHLMWFAADTVVGPFAGASVYDPDLVAARADAVRTHVRAVCRLPDLTALSSGA